MMRSLYSGVAGLKTHQTKMDVIGNNIANVNTTAYKSQNITFNELMYQTTKRASGANAETGVGGTNAGQIGLGVKVGAINTNISSQGAMQTTNLPFDIAITGDSFFIVSNGFENFFTRAGSFYVDGQGNLAMTSTGYNVMGWGVDPDNPNNIKKDTVQALRVMTEANLTYPPEATSKATVVGIFDKNDTDINSSTGKIINLEFFDNLGYKYTARISAHVINADTGNFYMQLDDILDSNGVSIGPDKMSQVEFGSTEIVDTSLTYLRRNQTTMTREVTLTAGGTPIVQTIGEDYVPGTTSGAMTLANITALYGPEAAMFADDGTGNLKAGLTYTISPNGTISIVAGGQSNGFALLSTSTAEITSVRITENLPGTTNILFPMPSSYVLDPPGTFSTTSNVAPAPVLTAEDVLNLFGIPLTGIQAFQINPDGTLEVTRKEVENAAIIRFNPGNGSFSDIAGSIAGLVTLGFVQGGSATVDMSNFTDIELNFSTTLMSNNNGKSTLSASAGGTGAERGIGTGRRIGDMIEIIVQDDGRIYANYDNGQSRLLGQISTATFANASGLEKRGDNLYSASMNSGEFDGIGEDIKAGGGYMTSGVLEMSNVDLSAEFTEMITTQRGFQANSRIITVSDSLLEELTNLKR